MSRRERRHQRFARIYSIELDDALYERVRTRFARAPMSRSCTATARRFCPALLSRLGEPSLFWLAGQDSGPGTAKGRRETPIVEEIGVDHARVFAAWPDYPTLEGFRQLVTADRPPFSASRERPG